MSNPLQLLGSALSAPAGSEQQQSELTQMRELLELQPALIHPLAGTLFPTVLPMPDSMLKFWVLDLVHFALSKSTLQVEAKASLAESCLNLLVPLLNDSTPRMLKVAIQCFSSVYPLLFRILCINRQPAGHWDQLSKAKTRITELLTAPTTSLGVKEAALKFVQRAIQVHTRGISDPRLQNKADPNLTIVPANHPFMNAVALENEGTTMMHTIVTLYYESRSADLLTSLINSWAPLVKHRPSHIQIVAAAIESWTPGSLQAANVALRDIRSVDKAAKIFMAHLVRTPHGAPFQTEILKTLHAIDMRLKAVAALEEEQRLAASRKRPAPGVDGAEGPDSKRAKLDLEVADVPAPAPLALADFDFSVLPGPLVVDFIVANLRQLSDERLQAAVQKFRDESAPAGASVAAVDMEPVIKAEPVDPLNMELDEELEFNSEAVNRQVALTSPAEETAVAATVQELEPATVLRLAEFVTPSVKELSEQQRADLLAVIDARSYDLVADTEEAAPVDLGEPRLTRSAELQATLIIRSITRSGVFEDLSPMTEATKKDEDDAGDADMQVDSTRRQDVMRAKLCEYILQDFSSRMRLAQLWMNEEWYNDRIRRERASASDPTPPEQHYDTWLRRILDAFRTRLDPRDRAFARFLLDLPELSDETLEMVREMCVERPDAVKVIGFATLRELVTMRVPVRDAALHILLDLTTHPEKNTRNPAIKTVRNWVPDTQPMGRAVEQFARGLLKRLQSPNAQQAAPAAPTVMSVDGPSEEDGQLPDDPHLVDFSNRQPAYLPPKLEEPLDKTVILQHVELVFALCIRAPEFLDEIFRAYCHMDAPVQEAVQELILPLIKGLGPNNGKLLMVLRAFPTGAESLALRVLTFFTSESRPTPPLIAVVRGLVAERELDPRFIVPILGEMDKADIVRHLPRLVSMLNGKPEERAVIKGVFSSVVTVPPSTTGTSNQPRAKQNELLSPAELLALLLQQEMTIGIKQTVEAINLCFSMPDLFGQEVLGIVMQQIVDEPTLPILFLRMVIQAIQTYKSLIGFVSTTLLSRLITKKIWQVQKLWEGFIRCAKLIAPASFGALLQLPKEQLRELIEQEPSLKAGLRNFVIQRAGNRARVAHFLEVFGDEGEGDEAQAQSQPLTPQNGTPTPA